jgi:hypothetical protein
MKCVNFIEIRFYAYLYASSFLVLSDHCTDTGSWIRGQIRIFQQTVIDLVPNPRITLFPYSNIQENLTINLYGANDKNWNSDLYWNVMFNSCNMMNYRKLNSGANTDIWGQIRIAPYLPWNNQHWLLAIIGHAKTNILQQNMW